MDVYTAQAMATEPSSPEISKKVKPILLLTTEKFLPARAHHRQAETLTSSLTPALQWDYTQRGLPFMES